MPAYPTTVAVLTPPRPGTFDLPFKVVELQEELMAVERYLKTQASSGAAIAVGDTASLDLTLTGTLLTGTVLASGIDHESLGGLLGGAADDHQHLTTAQVSGLHARQHGITGSDHTSWGASGTWLRSTGTSGEWASLTWGAIVDRPASFPPTVHDLLNVADQCHSGWATATPLSGTVTFDPVRQDEAFVTDGDWTTCSLPDDVRVDGTERVRITFDVPTYVGTVRYLYQAVVGSPSMTHVDYRDQITADTGTLYDSGTVRTTVSAFQNRGLQAIVVDATVSWIELVLYAVANYNDPELPSEECSLRLYGFQVAGSDGPLPDMILASDVGHGKWVHPADLLSRVALNAITLEGQTTAQITTQVINQVLTDVAHNDLSGLQGGASGDYQHLTTAQVAGLHDAVTVSGTPTLTLALSGQLLSGTVLASGIPHDALGSLSGGASGDYQHLTTAQVAALHPAVTVADSASVDLSLSGQQISATVLPSGISHEDLGGLLGGGAGDHQHLTSAQVSGLHAAVTVLDSATVDLSLSGQQISATVLPSGISHEDLGGLLGGAASDHQHLTTAQVAALHPAVTVLDSATVDLSLSGQQISATVLPSGISHNELSSLQGGEASGYYHLTPAQVSGLHARQHEITGSDHAAWGSSGTWLRSTGTSGEWASIGWSDVGKTGSSLADLETRTHSSLTGIGADDHHARQHGITGSDHTDWGSTGTWLRSTGTSGQWSSIGWSDVDKTGSSLADLATRAHSSLTGIGANDHHAQQHGITGSDHSSWGASGTVLQSTGSSGQWVTLTWSSISDPPTGFTPVAHDLLNVADQYHTGWATATQASGTVTFDPARNDEAFVTDGDWSTYSTPANVRGDGTERVRWTFAEPTYVATLRYLYQAVIGSPIMTHLDYRDQVIADTGTIYDSGTVRMTIPEFQRRGLQEVTVDATVSWVELVMYSVANFNDENLPSEECGVRLYGAEVDASSGVVADMILASDVGHGKWVHPADLLAKVALNAVTLEGQTVTQITTQVVNQVLTDVPHNDLSGLQGGASGDYQHLTTAQVTGLHEAVSVLDTASVNLSLSGQQISATVLPAGVDHGGLAGLGDDDHPLYIKASGTRAFTGDQSLGGYRLTTLGSPQNPGDAATKGYVDALVQGIDWQSSVKSRSLNAPPPSPASGDRYLVGAAASGAWAGHADDFAVYDGSSWIFTDPTEGSATWVEDEDVLYVYNGGWARFGSTIDHGNLIGLADDDHPQYHNDARALTWLGGRSTSDLPEGTRLYYTDARARAALSGASPITYNITSGVIGVTTGTTAGTVAAGNHNHSGTYEPVIASGTTSQYWRGDKTWQTLNATAVGLGNVANAAQVQLQASTPGTTQTGHSNISGTSRVGSLIVTSGTAGTSPTSVYVGSVLTPGEDGSATAFQATYLTVGGGATNLAAAYGLQIGASSWTKGTTGTITTAYGIYVSPPSIATNNYAIYTTGGTTSLGGTLKLSSLGTGLLKVTSGTVGLATPGTDYEAPLTSGTTGQFLRGDKTWTNVLGSAASQLGGYTPTLSLAGSETSTSAAQIELRGYRTAADVGLLGRLSWHNALSTATEKRVAQIDGYANGDVEAGSLRFYTADAAGTLTETLRITPFIADVYGLLRVSGSMPAAGSVYGAYLTPTLIPTEAGLGAGISVVQTVGSGGTNIGDAIGLYVPAGSWTKGTSGTVSRAYGLYITPPALATTNYALYTTGGAVSLGGTLTVRNRSDLILSNASDLPRWILRTSTATEGGSNTGSDLEFHRRADDGSYIGPVLTLHRDTGQVEVTTGLKVLSLSGLLKASAGVVSTAVAGTDYEAPLAVGTTGQFYRGDKTWSNRLVGALQTAAGTTAGGTHHLSLMTSGGSYRWGQGLAGDESSGNLGSDFRIWRYDDAGAYLGTPVMIQRSNGLVYLESGLRVQSLNGILKASTGVVSAAAAGTDYEAPLGSGTTAQFLRGDKTWSNLLLGGLGVADWDYTSTFSSASFGQVISSNTNSAALRIATLGSNPTHDPYINFLVSGEQNWMIGVDNDDAEKLKIALRGAPFNGTNEFLVINTGGSVGIGTSSPTTGKLLDVNGAARIGGSLTAQDVLPAADSTYNLGSPSAYWSNVYTDALTASLVNVGSYQVTRTFGVSFNNTDANQKVALLLPAGTGWMQGGMEIALGGGYPYNAAIGLLVKQFSFCLDQDSNTSYYYESQIPTALGPIADMVAIGEMEWDAALGRWKIVLANRTPAPTVGINFSVTVRGYRAPNTTDAVGAMELSSVYTTDPTVYPLETANLVGPVGIGTDAAGDNLVIKGTDRIAVTLGTRDQHTQLYSTYEGLSYSALDITGPDSGYALLNLVSNQSGTAGVTRAAIMFANRYGLTEGTDELRIAQISAYADGSPQAAALLFQTRGTGDASPLERVRITSTGRVGIGQTVPSTQLDVVGPLLSSSYPATMLTATTNGYAQDMGGGIGFQGKYNAAGSQAVLAVVQGVKENATDGNYAGALRFLTRAHGGASLTEAMRISSVGKVGVGAVSPLTTLSVRLSSATTSPDNTNGLAIYNENATNNNLAGIWFGQGDGVTASPGGSSGAGLFGVHTSHTPGSRNAELAFWTTYLNTAGERVRITAAGQVGIGTPTPTAGYLLDVQGGIYTNGRVGLQGARSSFLTGDNQAAIYATINSTGGTYPFDGSNYNHLVLQARSSVAQDIVLATGTTPAARLVVKGDGKVGVGTSTPLYDLSVRNDTTATLLLQRNAAVLPSAQIRMSGLSGGAEVHGAKITSYNGSLNFYTQVPSTTDNLTSHLTITSDGKVGIHNGSPVYALDITSDLTRISNASGDTLFRLQPADSTGAAEIEFGFAADPDRGRIRYQNSDSSLGIYTDNTERIHISQNGSVGIGTSDPGFTLDVVGPARFTSTVAFTSGTPFTVPLGSSTITNLSADKLDGYHATDFILAGSAVTSLNAKSGAISLLAGGNIAIDNSVNGQITISATGSAGGVTSIGGTSGTITLASTLTMSGQQLQAVTGTTAGTLAVGNHSHSYVTALNSKTGSISLLAGSNIAIDNSVGGQITISATGVGGGGVTSLGGASGAITLAGTLTMSGQQLQVVTGTTAGTIALGDHTHSAYPLKVNNLSDLGDIAMARSNLQLGNAATKNVGTGAVDVAAGNHTHNYVTALNSKTGSISLLAGSNVTIDNSVGGQITISAAGGSGGGVTSIGGVSGAITLAGTLTMSGQQLQVVTGTTAGTIALGNHTHSTYLVAVSGLADLPNAATARVNLGLGNSATRDVGTGSGDVATGNHTHSGYLVAASGLADLPNAATARSNLGLGNSATRDVGTGSGDVAAGNHTHTSLGTLSVQNLSVVGTAVFNGGKTGYVVDICWAEEDLEPGDVVVALGTYGDPVVGEIPVPRVRKLRDEEESEWIVGVVDRKVRVRSRDRVDLARVPAPIAAGHYLAVVTLGAFQGVKVRGPVRAGQKLTGYREGVAQAKRSLDSLGKALADVPEGEQAIIPVLVTLA